MFFDPNQNNNTRMKNCNGKRIFLTLLFLNAFLGCIYYINEQKSQQIASISPKLLHEQKANQSSMKTCNAIEFIQNTLANEYHEDDLLRFYAHVKDEYSLGLRCTRKQDTSQSVVSSDRANEANKTFFSHHFRRTELHKYLIDQSDACANQSIDLVIIIMSKSDNYQTRDAIRRTWGLGKNLGIYSSIKMKYFFLIDFDQTLSRSIELENDLFHDIIQVELPQQYTLVTSRVISIFEWSFRYCRSAKFLFKSDDDIFFNLLLLLKFISPLIEQPIDQSFLIPDMKIYGYEHVLPRVFRHATGSVLSRYLISYEEYPCERYPTFLSGYGYLISKKARDAILYTAYQDPEPFRISDVYLTGIIPDYLSIPRQSMSNYTLSDGNCAKFFNSSQAFVCATPTHHGAQTTTFSNYNEYWRLIQKRHQFA